MGLMLDPGRTGQRQNGTKSTRPRGQELPKPLRHRLEAELGADLSRVRVHEGHQATHVGAVVYTKGNDLHFAPGAYDPTSSSCQEIIGHELAHVVQQRAVPPPPVVPCGMVQVVEKNKDKGKDREKDSRKDDGDES